MDNNRIVFFGFFEVNVCELQFRVVLCEIVVIYVEVSVVVMNACVVL